jgi:hypothetical protein
MESEMILPNHADPQKYGSLISYYKRYQLQAMLGVSTTDEDDDANMVSQPQQKQAPVKSVPHGTNSTQKSNAGANTNTPASDAQKNALTKMGIYYSSDITKSEASKLIESANKNKRN